MKMYRKDRKLFGKALEEALLAGFEEEMQRCEEFADVSAGGVVSISDVKTQKQESASRPLRWSRKTWVAILVAVLLMLVGCGTYIYRREILEFLEETFETGILLSYKDRNPVAGEEITEKYMVTYLPEGYYLEKKVEKNGIRSYMWYNETGGCIMFDQSMKDAAVLEFKNNGEEPTIFNCNGFEIYARSYGESNVYVWISGKYIMTLYVSADVTQEESLEILESIGEDLENLTE